MVNTKTTIHKFTTPGGSEIECTVTRTYGYKRIEKHEEEAWLDQPVTIKHPANDEFVNEYTISVSVNGKAYGEFKYDIDLDRRVSNGKVLNEGYNALTRYNSRQRVIIPLSAKDDEIIHRLITERLNDELSPSDLDDIKTVKIHIADKSILPMAELEARKKKYRDDMLEGGEGFNPYYSYITKEFADRIISQFPQYFK